MRLPADAAIACATMTQMTQAPRLTARGCGLAADGWGLALAADGEGGGGAGPDDPRLQLR